MRELCDLATCGVGEQMRGEAITRQLKLLSLLEARREGVGIDEAAAEVGARRRTVYRDFRVLEEAGFPLVSDREGRRARWKILEGFRHRLQLSLSWSELLGLVVARQVLAGLAGTVFHDGASSALEKIRVTLPRPLAEKLKEVGRVASASTPFGADYGARGAMVCRLLEAVDQRRTIEVRYRSRAPKRLGRERLLDPYHVHVDQRGLYLFAFCHRSGAVKTFRLDRMDEVRLTERTFSAPSEFDAGKFVRPMFGMWASGRPRQVRFVVSAEVAPLFMERKVHASQVVQRRSDGTAEVRLEVTVGPPLVAYLTGLGAEVIEIEPEELARAVRDAHRRALERSGGWVEGRAPSRQRR